VAIAPGNSIVGGLLLLIPALQMIAGRSTPSFQRWIADRPLPARKLGAVAARAISVLRSLEKVVRPRFPTPPKATKFVVGILVLLLTARLLLMPIPLSNILLEGDGVLLSISLLAGVVVLTIDLGLIWQLLHGARGLVF
jgi:hypothetical protein